jgi:D-alanyl-D-alanine carboxypeptidase
MKYYTLLFVLIMCSLVQCTNSNSSTNTTDRSPDPNYAPTPASLDITIDTSIAYIMGKFNPEELEGFVEIDTQFADRPGLFLREETYLAFRSMYDHALEDGVRLVIRSATRNFIYQKGIWERKWSGERNLEGDLPATEIQDPVKRAITILKYSSMPGTSRHHWGTDIDLNSFSNRYFSSGEGLKIYDWLKEHAPSYGFCQPYSEKGENRMTGYEEEKWHWSYIPVSGILTSYAGRHLDESMITGFLGSETAPEIKVVKKYVLGINPECL